jgi:hypothetical protein
MVCRPVLLRLFLECGRVLQHLRPLLLAVLQKETGVEVDAVVDLCFGRLSMLETNLIVSMACRFIVDALLQRYTLPRTELHYIRQTASSLRVYR